VVLPSHPWDETYRYEFSGTLTHNRLLIHHFACNHFAKKVWKNDEEAK
jgi:hypothetical protein